MSRTASDYPPCDPCQWLVVNAATNKKAPCGWAEGTNIRPHLKSHKARSGKTLTLAEYRKKFPKALLGPPQFIPSADHMVKMQKNNPKFNPELAAMPVEERKPDKTKIRVTPGEFIMDQEKLDIRTDELQRMVNFDKAANQFCIQAAREEQRSEWIDNQLDLELGKKSPGIEQIKFLRQSSADSTKILQNLFKHLDLTVKQRREDNQLGDQSTVSQLISNYANTRRKWSVERNRVFDGQMSDALLVCKERVERRIISQAPQRIGKTKDVEKEQLKTDDDFTSAILNVGDQVREL